MTKKLVYLLALLAMLLLTACGTQPDPVTAEQAAQTPAAQDSAVQQTPANDGEGRQFDPANQPIEQKLAIGTLKLEGTDLAVTAEQAKALLPLWKAVKALSTSETVSMEEVNAVYTQIQETMTEEQITAIKTMTFNPEDMQALMDELGIEIEMPAGGGERPELTEEQLATMQARREEMSQGQGGQGFQGGRMPGGEAASPGGEGAMPGGGVPPMEGGLPNVQGTPQPGMIGPRGAGGGFNTTLVEPLITLLQERAGL